MLRLASARFAASLLFWVASATAGIAGAAEIRGLRLSQEADHTRAVFELSAPLQYRLFGLSNPDRLVLDVSAATLGPTFAAAAGNELLSRVRTGKQGNDLRIVFDLARGVRPKSFLLPPDGKQGHRLVVDLFPQDAAQSGVPLPVKAATLAGQRKIVVAIDAGHGGKDPGARGASGSWEKNITLAVARELARQIDREPGFESFLVRDGDYYLVHQQRYEKARKANADLFVSIHANAYHDRDMTGTAVYVLSPKGASSTHATMLANRENMSDLIGGVDIGENDDATTAVLIDIMQASAMEASYDVGARLLSSMGRVNNLQKPRVQQASFLVLKSPDIPSVLVETAFLTNEEEARKLTDADYQERMARSMLDGIKGYFQSYRPQQQIALDPPRGGFQPVSLEGAAAR